MDFLFRVCTAFVVLLLITHKRGAKKNTGEFSLLQKYLVLLERVCNDHCHVSMYGLCVWIK